MDISYILPYTKQNRPVCFPGGVLRVGFQYKSKRLKVKVPGQNHNTNSSAGTKYTSNDHIPDRLISCNLLTVADHNHAKAIIPTIAPSTLSDISGDKKTAGGATCRKIKLLKASITPQAQVVIK